jgi:group I intron endonuclease
MNKVYIYTISDPRTKEVVYVGKTKDFSERVRKHRTENNGTKKSKWMKGLRIKGLEPVFEIIEECSDSTWEARERYWISFYRSLIGPNLLNQLEGGEGGPTMLGKKLTTEQRLKITASKLGKPNYGAATSNKINKGSKVLQYDLQGNFINEHLSIRDAARAIGRSDRRIQKMVKGETINGRAVNSVGGYYFKLG